MPELKPAIEPRCHNNFTRNFSLLIVGALAIYFIGERQGERHAGENEAARQEYLMNAPSPCTQPIIDCRVCDWCTNDSAELCCQVCEPPPPID